MRWFEERGDERGAGRRPGRGRTGREGGMGESSLEEEEGGNYSRFLLCLFALRTSCASLGLTTFGGRSSIYCCVLFVFFKNEIRSQRGSDDARAETGGRALVRSASAVPDDGWRDRWMEERGRSDGWRLEAR